MKTEAHKYQITLITLLFCDTISIAWGWKGGCRRAWAGCSLYLFWIKIDYTANLMKIFTATIFNDNLCWQKAWKLSSYIYTPWTKYSFSTTILSMNQICLLKHWKLSAITHMHETFNVYEINFSDKIAMNIQQT